MILLTLSRGKGEETVRLQLPASPAEIGETFAFLDRISLDTTATAILDVSSNVPVLYRCLYDVDVEDSEQFQKLQKLAERTEALSPAKAAIFSGALDAECVWNLEGALSKSKRLEDRLMPEKQKKTIRELTLMLMYLTSWEERDTPEMRAVKKKELEKYPLVRRCWKGYDHDLLNKLSEEGLINAAGRTYPALITPEGEAEARKLLAQYGIDTEERRRCSAER